MTQAPVRLPGREETTRGGVGMTVVRPDADAKVRGAFAYASDLHVEGMLWGATVRSPFPHARIGGIDTTAARALPGVRAVLTADDVPGRRTYGLEHADQPVLAWDLVRYAGEPVVVVAAEDPDTARRAAALVEVRWEPLEPVVDAEASIAGLAPALHPGGNVLRHVPIRRGDPDAVADVVVRGVYEVGMQDQAFLGPESGLALPDGAGGVELRVATQWLHVDQEQVAASLGLPIERVRVVLAGVGGAFGAREDVSMQIHASLLALRTNRPVKMVYVRARIVLDGGAYASSSTAVVSNAASFACGPYEVPNASIDAYVVYSNNPPCGAMRGFGAVQACVGYEAQMDRLAAALGLDPVELRIRNAMRTGSTLPTGQAVSGPVPVADLLERCRAMPLPGALPELGTTAPLPGGLANTTHGEGVRRGVGYAVGIKNIGYSEGFDDYSTARVRLDPDELGARVTVHTAAVEVGQGLVTVQAQIARTELGVEEVVVQAADTTVGSAGSSSASRQTWMTGGAVRAACIAVREEVLARAAERLAVAVDDLELVPGGVVERGSGHVVPLAELLEAGPIEATREYHHRPTEPLDPVTGRGEAHVAFAFAAHRVVADVDCDLGLVRVVEIATVQDVGRAMNPQAVEGQIEGGIAQGLGLALMEEIRVTDGVIRNPTFTDYLIPTTLDMPPVRLEVLELGDPDAPYGLKGVGEPPTVSSTAAVAAAVRAACGRELPRVPIRPEHVVGLA